MYGSGTNAADAAYLVVDGRKAKSRNGRRQVGQAKPIAAIRIC
jgi:hypothetical protein